MLALCQIQTSMPCKLSLNELVLHLIPEPCDPPPDARKDLNRTEFTSYIMTLPRDSSYRPYLLLRCSLAALACFLAAV